jgi:hypothetical protein
MAEKVDIERAWEFAAIDYWQRKILFYYYDCRWTLEEIGEALGLHRTTVASYRDDALILLTAELNTAQNRRDQQYLANIALDRRD